MSSHLLKLRRLQQVSATSKSRSVGVEDSYFRRFRRNPWFHVALGGATSLMAYVLLDESIVAEDVSQSNNANTSNQHDMYSEAAQLLEKNTQQKTQFPLPILPIIASPLLQPHRCDCEASKFNLFGRISSLRRSNTIETNLKRVNIPSEACTESTGKNPWGKVVLVLCMQPRIARLVKRSHSSRYRKSIQTIWDSSVKWRHFCICEDMGESIMDYGDSTTAERPCRISSEMCCIDYARSWVVSNFLLYYFAIQRASKHMWSSRKFR